MVVKRLTRVETQAQTRERLLDAAEAAFAAEGFAGASLDRIAEAAGLTRGAVYSNFADKPDLFVSVLERRLSQRAAEIADAMAADGFVDQLRSGVGTRRSARELRRWVILHDEFRLYALRHPGAAKRLARHERHERDLYVRAIAYQLERRGVSLPADARLMAAIMFALDTSLPRQHLIDPEDVAETAYGDAVALLLRAAIALDAAGR